MIRWRLGFVDEEDIFRVDPVTTKRASGMGVEPGVHAFDVESVFAFWEEPEDFGGFEPGETNGAFKAFLLASEGSESENR